MKVREIMKKKVVTCSPNETIQEVIGRMDNYGVKEIPVLDGEKLVGLVSYYDFFEVKTPGPVKVNSIMISPPTINPETKINDLLKLMADSGIEGIPVMEKGELVGFVSEYDVLKEFEKDVILKELQVSDLLKTGIPVMKEFDGVQKAKRLMGFHGIDRLAVIDKEDKYVGMIILLDILRACFRQVKFKVGSRDYGADFKKFMSGPVKELARKNLPEIFLDTPIRKALKMLLKNKLKGSVVINKLGTPVGLILRKDILKYIAKMLKKQGVIINFSGIDLKPNTIRTLGNIMKEHIAKITRNVSYIESVNVHIKPLHDAVKEKRYQMKLALKAPGHSFNVKEEGWDVFFTFDRLLDRLEMVLNKEYYEKRPEIKRVRKSERKTAKKRR